MTVQERNPALVALLEPDFLRRDDWQTWAPVVSQPAAVAANVIYARYNVLANLVILTAKLSVTGAGVGGNAVTISGIPAALAIANNSLTSVHGSGLIYDAGGNYYHVGVVSPTNVTLQFIGYNVAGPFGIAPAIALAAGDDISFSITYERS